MKRIETELYRVSRTQLATWTAYEYVRRMWPALLAFPVTGVLIIALIPVREVQAIGLLMLLWPLTIFARAILITRKAAKRATAPTRMIAEGEHLYFVTEPPELNYRVHKDSVRELTIRYEFVVIELWRFRLVFLPYSSFKSPEDVRKLRVFLGVDEIL